MDSPLPTPTLTPALTGGVFERESLCLSLSVAEWWGGETVNAVGVVLVFGFLLEELCCRGGNPEREMVRVVRCFLNTSSSSSSSYTLKSSSRKYGKTWKIKVKFGLIRVNRMILRKDV